LITSKQEDMNIPRKHHYVPETYLNGFTADDGRLFAIHRDGSKVRPSIPRKEAHERDFYKLDEGEDLLAIETYFASIEDHWPSMRQTLFESGGLPTDPAVYATLMTFIAIQHIRVPGFLDRFDECMSRVLKDVMYQMFKDKETYESVVGPNEGNTGSHSFEEMRKFALSDEYDIRLDQNTRLVPFVEALPKAAAVLAGRNWVVRVASDTYPDFITSDRPVTVHWNNDSSSGLYPPNIGLANTSVVFPVSKRAALIGLFEDPQTIDLMSPTLVGKVNWWSSYHAKRYIFGPAKDFRVTLDQGKPGGREDFLAWVKQNV
jgi:hypothetical protein